MDYLPKDPAILVSSVNMLLRDGMPMYKGIAVFSETVKTDRRLTEKAEG